MLVFETSYSSSSFFPRVAHMPPPFVIVILWIAKALFVVGLGIVCVLEHNERGIRARNARHATKYVWSFGLVIVFLAHVGSNRNQNRYCEPEEWSMTASMGTIKDGLFVFCYSCETSFIHPLALAVLSSSAPLLVGLLSGPGLEQGLNSLK